MSDETRGVHPLVAKYDEGGLIEPAVVNAEQREYALMRRLEGGVPSRVLFGGNLMAFDRYSQQLVAMFMDITARQFGWSEQQKNLQTHMVTKLFQLIRHDSMIIVLEDELTRRKVTDDGQAKGSESGVSVDDPDSGEGEAETESDEERNLHAEAVRRLEEGSGDIPPVPTIGEDPSGSGLAPREVPPGQDRDDDS